MAVKLQHIYGSLWQRILHTAPRTSRGPHSFLTTASLLSSSTVSLLSFFFHRLSISLQIWLPSSCKPFSTVALAKELLGWRYFFSNSLFWQAHVEVFLISLRKFVFPFSYVWIRKISRIKKILKKIIFL